MTVLVAGATGTTGSEVIRRLRAADVPVRAMTRDARAAGELAVPAVVADLADPQSLSAAVDGCDAIYVATNASPQLPELEAALAAAARDAGVGLLVKLSVIGAAADSPLRFANLHHASERAIVATGVPATFVRPNGFMQNTLGWAGQISSGVVHGPVMDAKWSIVDVRDVAAVAVAALRDPAAHAGQVYTCTGPEATSPREQVAILAELLGRPLEAREIPLAAARSAMVDQGWPAWAADRMAELFAHYAEGNEQALSPDVERVTGQPPRSFRSFAADHLEAFRPRTEASSPVE